MLHPVLPPASPVQHNKYGGGTSSGSAQDLSRKEAQRAPSDSDAAHHPMAPPGVRHTASPYVMHPPQFAHARELEAAQDLSWRGRSPHDAFRSDMHRGEPRDYGAPWETPWKSRTGDGGGGGPAPQMMSPPPAHSHHQRPHTDKLYQLANAATEQQRIDKDHLPRGYHNDRSQVTPPALQSSISPYAATPPGGQQQRSCLPRTTIGQPPPLINIKETIEPKMLHEKALPGIQTHPSGGSITHGTPVNQPLPGGGMRGGSISMGTPHYDACPRQPTPPQSRPEGVVSRAAPFGYDHMGRPVAVSHESGVAMRMPMVFDAAAAAAAMNRGMPMMVYPGAVEQMYRRPGFQGMPFMPGVPPGVAGVPGGAAQFADYNSSSRATLMGDFLTAQQMHLQQEAVAQRRDKDRQMSPRGRDMPPAKSPYDPQLHASMPYTTVSTPQGLVAIPHHPVVTQVNSNERPSSRTRSPMPPPSHHPYRDITPPHAPPHENSSPMAWPIVTRHGPLPPQLSPGGMPPGPRPREAYSPGGLPPGARPREAYLPPRQNVIQQHGKPQGSVIMEPRMSPLTSSRVDGHYMIPDSTSPRHMAPSSFDTLVKVASRYGKPYICTQCPHKFHAIPK